MKQFLVAAAAVISFCAAADVFAAGEDRRAILGSPSSVIVTVPAQYSGANAILAELKDGSYGIVVRLKYRRGWPTDGLDFASAVFRISQGAIVREGSDLYWVKGRSRVHVAWAGWGRSTWVLNQGVKIQYKVERVPSERAFDQFRVSAALVF